LNKIGNINKINRMFSELEQKHEREPTAEEIAEALGIGESDVKDGMYTSSRHVSMDAPLIDGEDGSMIDVMRNETSP
ncbi:hypothetical protein NK983_35795, partial [Salmonella enterica subsp. enterica serovar Typhimurium]|nr:hypothetical protein [Salmonella enterica subsp. enterica serovar Typhimurium]